MDAVGLYKSSAKHCRQPVEFLGDLKLDFQVRNKNIVVGIGVPEPDPGAKSSSDPADFGAVKRSADPY